MKQIGVGRRRLIIALCGSSAALCSALMVAVLVVYGTPYNPLWWWVMVAILLAAAILPVVLVWPIEWVIAGYQKRDPL